MDGESHIRYIVEIVCNGDALRFIVTQRGGPDGFYHLNTFSYWSEPNEIQQLYVTFGTRLQSGPEVSSCTWKCLQELSWPGKRVILLRHSVDRQSSISIEHG